MSLKPFLNKSHLIAFASLCALSAPTLAAKPHEHGVATLNIAIDGNEVEVELDTPADNIAGFEHQPRTDEQKKIAVAAVKKLNAPNKNVLSFPKAAGCTLEEVDIDSPFDGDDDHDKHDHDKHDHDKHDHDKHDHDKHDHDKHDHDKHDHDKHDHDKHDHDKHDHDHDDDDVHSDFEVEYEYKCNNTAAIKQVDLSNLFTNFANFQTVKVNWTTPKGQSAARATAKNSVIQLGK